MLRSLAPLLLLATTASAQIWPEAWHGSTRVKAESVQAADPMLWAEYGGEAAGKAVYNGPVGKFSATGWRFRDATSALAYYQAIRPENCTAPPNVLTACTTPGMAFIARQNYVLQFEGWRPLENELAELSTKLPRIRSGGGLPLLPGYLPSQGRIRNSERYVMGLYSLQKFLPQVPPELAGIEDGAEAQFARFTTPAGEAPLAVFYFHTPQLARAKEAEFQKQAGWTVRRSGPLVAFVPGGVDPKAAQSLLAGLDWKVEFIWNQATKMPPVPDVAGMLVAIFELTGVLLVACVGGGLVFAFVALWFRRRRARLTGSDDALTYIQLRWY